MKKINRILKNSNFAVILKKGKKLNSSYFSIYYINKEQEYFRVGISVSKKVSKRAVDRNKIKRQISSIMYENKQLLTNFDLVLIAKPKILGTQFQEIKHELKTLLLKL